MNYVILLLLLFGVVWLISGPLRRDRATAVISNEADTEQAMQRIDLEAARDAKYREIRDAELDHQTGKLSDQDYAAIDSTLRSEAIALLHQLDELHDGEQTEQGA